MPTYRAPVEDYRFLLTELFDASSLTELPGYEEASPELMTDVIAEAANFCENVLFPLNQSGDAEGCTWHDGVVTTPAGFKDAFAQYAQGGWVGLTTEPQYGGQGLPELLRLALDEMVCASNLSFAMYPALTQGVIAALQAHGTTEQQQLYIPSLASGKWAGTMCLTEAHAGTDLGLLRTKADPMDDGSFTLTGQKIFITAGEHDLTENIIHMVLARLPDAPQGSRGISLFLVPKFLVNADGSRGARNSVTCGSIEHKMGIRASATCVLNFDGARGFLVGAPQKGLRAMFTMMNAARIGVGLQGLGLADAAYHSAVAYARERLQGRAPASPHNQEGMPDAIIDHPDIRRSLLFIRAFTEGARALTVFTALHLDAEHRHPDPAKREEAEDIVALLTPIIKAFYTDMGFESTNLALQVFGGHGYIREYGVEQYVRDARIGQIYEGTNHIQALDLIGRKLGTGEGRLLKRYAAIVAEEVALSTAISELAPLAESLGATAKRLESATLGLLTRSAMDATQGPAVANDYLRAFGFLALGHMWLRSARIAVAKRSSGGARPPEFYEQKLALARFYFARMLPQTRALFAAIEAGGDAIMAFPRDGF